MLVNFDKTGRVVWYNLEISKESSIEYLSESTIWMDCDMPEAENREGYNAVFYVNEDRESVRVEYEPEAELEITQLDRIEEMVKKSQAEIKNDGAKEARAVMIPMGAKMTFALESAGLDVPPEAGAFAEKWNPWEPDGETAPVKSLWKYQGVGYQARIEVKKIEEYAPDKATNSYAVRTIPDANGIFPGMLNMDVSIGMKVRDWEDGKVYLCYANPITSLQWPPHQVEASFILYEEGK